MEFGITIKPDLTVDRIVSLTRQAESAGFRHHSDRNMGTFSIRRFERPTEYPQNSSDPAA